MLSLLKKIKNRLNQSKTSKFSQFNFEKILKVKEDNKYIYFDYTNQHLIIRNKIESSDYNVMKQIFVEEEYRIVVDFFNLNQIDMSFVIDAGANIGFTTSYLKSHYPHSKIACIEPDSNNNNILKKNLKKFIDNGSVKNYQAGLMGTSGINLKIGEDFRGGSDWAKQTLITNEKTGLSSITIQEIMVDFNMNSIDLLKIDIEGAERFLIDPETDLSFLDVTKIIAIEIHDEFDIRDDIYSVLKSYNYLLFESNETTIAINKNLI